jgi:hypothetical protein
MMRLFLADVACGTGDGSYWNYYIALGWGKCGEPWHISEHQILPAQDRILFLQTASLARSR